MGESPRRVTAVSIEGGTRLGFEPTTWTCHVCGDERPDDKIAVHSEGGGSEYVAEISVHVRYCNDRPNCKLGAPEIADNWLSVWKSDRDV